MQELLTDEKLRTKFSRNIAIRANEHFTLNIMINNYIQPIKNPKPNTHE